MKIIFRLKNLVILTIISTMIAGCGIPLGTKKWPQPLLDEDKFSWESITAWRESGCLSIEVAISGDYQNLETVVLLFESLGPDGCDTCPFVPDQALTYNAASPEYKRKGKILSINKCGLNPNEVYRWKIIGSNKFSALGQVESKVYTMTPAN